MNLLALKNKLKKKIVEFPQTPGVYVFHGAKKEILYVGKATNLRSRVRSYFPPSSQSSSQSSLGGRGGYVRPIEKMINQVADIKIQETDSVLEALILESNLIKKYQPKYNVKEKDDKSFSYFVVTKEEFPRIIILRKTDLSIIESSKIYGPYTSKYQMEAALKIIRRIFPFHSMKQKTEKGCLDFQLGRCPGPYADAISKQDYAKNIRGIRMILEGKKKSLIGKMEKEMQEAAKKNEFEKAAQLRNKIFALNHIRDVALVSDQHHPAPLLENEREDMEKTFRIEAYDISNISGQNAVGSMIVFDNSSGELCPNKSQYRKFRIKTIGSSDDVGMMREVLQRRFQNYWTLPNLILLDGGQGHLNMAEKVLNNFKLNIPLVAVAKGKSRKNQEIRSKQEILKTKEILNDKNLIKNIMDEAHRFAIAYHRKKRSQELLG
ncbi:MAG: hypothetical protein ACD_11C00013G0009 [uncultured bacterium]|nr:MAG: hypothetical protein ACD_11C00013G0009 [uncultured bacterium]HBR71671.1 hypothetical protein [Candidatus Moranbacteria bacterium]